MSDDLSPHERAVRTGLNTARRYGGVPVTYSRGATTLTVNNALQSTTVKANIEVGGEEQVVETQLWLIAVNDLASLGTPEVGDIIARNIQGTVYSFTVETLDFGDVAWDWTDTGKTQFAINTRKDGASAYEVSEPNGFDLQGNELRY